MWEAEKSMLLAE